MFRARTAENVAIFVGLQWFNRILGVVTKVILARLLFPNDFGAFAIATGLIGFVGTFGNFGLDYAIIQKGEGATTRDYDVAMSLRLLIAGGLFVASVIAAGPWATFFNKPAGIAAVVAPSIQVLALMYLVLPWSFIPSTRLTKELRYRAIAVPNLAGQVTNAAIPITLALAGFGVWSLVYGLLISQVVSTVTFVAVRREGFRFRLDRTVAGPLVAFSRHIVSASLLAFLITNIDNFTVAAILGVDKLGYYAVAYGFGYLPISLISSPAGSALFPSLTKLQSDAMRLREAYLESFSYVASLIVPAGIGLSILAPEIVHILLGPTWIPATFPLVILGFYGLGRGLVDFSSSLFAAVGRPRIIALQNLYILILSLVLLLPLTIYYDISGTSLAMTIPVLVVAGLSLRQSAKTLGSRTRDLLRRLLGPLAAAAAMGGLLYLLRSLMYAVLPGRVALVIFNTDLSEVTIVLLVGLPVGMVAYFLALRFIDPQSFHGMVRQVHMLVVKNPRVRR